MSKLDRTHAPRAPATATFRFPSFERRRLASGLELWIMERRGAPLASLRLLVPAGGHFQPTRRPGLAAFTAALLEQGTRRRTAREIADTIESLGGSLATGAGWNVATISAGVLSHHLHEALDLLAEVATCPTFPGAEVERLRRERLAEWLRRRDQAGALAEEAFLEAVYADSAYGHPLLGDRQALRSLERDEIAAFWEAHRTARGSALLVVGDVENAGAAMAEQVLAGLGDAAAPVPPPIRPASRQRRVVLVDRPTAAQTELRVGHSGPPRDHPDHTVLALANSLFGGKFTSRVNLNLRERHGYTYGAHSAFAARLGPGPFVVRTATANPVVGASVREILGEIERLREEPVPEAEIEEATSYLRGVFPYGLQTNAGALRRLQELAVFSLPEDWFDRHLEALGEVAPEDLGKAVRRHLEPHRASIIAVGPAAELRDQLADLGEVEIVRPQR